MTFLTLFSWAQLVSHDPSQRYQESSQSGTVFCAAQENTQTGFQEHMEVDTNGRLPMQQAGQHTYNVREFIVAGTAFECPSRYELVRNIGQGAYGIVCSARDVTNGEMVAIKKIPNVIDTDLDCKRTLREMRLLRHFQHENVISLKHVYIPCRSTKENFTDVYTVMELMDTDLHQVISSGQVLTDDHLQYFTYQILRSLKHIHCANVIHRDLKPSNILLNGNCDLKICDFGLARANSDCNMTAYVMTRWYRAPEIVLWQNYTSGVDMWSVGCILGEMLLGKPLFPGTDHMKQLFLVVNMIGSPSDNEINKIESESSQKYVRNNLMNRSRKSMHDVFPNAPELLKDLLDKILVFDASKRISVDDALKHPYLESLNCYDDDIENVQRFSFEYDTVDDGDKETLKRAIWEEAQRYQGQQMA